MGLAYYNHVTMKCKIFVFLLVVIIIFTGITASGCNGYRKYTFNNTIANCSFDVPLSFGPLSVDNVSENFVSIFGTSILNKESSDLYLSADVSLISDSYPDYKTLLEDHLKWAKQGQGEDEFNLIERLPITIAGVQGEKITYYYTIHHEARIIDNEIIIPEPTQRIKYEAFFENDGILWHIGVSAIVERTEEAQSTFTRIIDTFELLK